MAVRYVDHTYRDYSRYVEDGGELIKHKKCTNNFPARLHRMLSEPGNEEIIAWMPHGRAWKVLDRDRLITEVIPRHLVGKKYESFTRQLNGWGFKRLHQTGPDFGCYYHECFLRNLPELTCLIRRLSSNMGKSTPYPEGEPNFYRISEQFPVPPDTTFSAEEKTPRTASEPTKAVAPPRGRAMSEDTLKSGQLSDAPQVSSGSTASLQAAAATSVGPEGLAVMLSSSGQAVGPYPPPDQAYPPQAYPSEQQSYFPPDHRYFASYDPFSAQMLGPPPPGPFDLADPPQYPYQLAPPNRAPREQEMLEPREAYARQGSLPLSTMSSMSCVSHSEKGCCPEKPLGAEQSGTESVDDDVYEPIPFA